MRQSALLIPFVLVLGCKVGGEAPAFFSEALREDAVCLPIESLNQRGTSVADVSEVGDSAFLVLFDSDRELVLYDDLFNPLTTITFERAGPRGVGSAGSAATDGRLFHVVDEKTFAIKTFDAQGNDRGSVRTAFPARRIRVAGDAVYIAPYIIGGSPSALLFRITDGTAKSVSLPIARYEDAVTSAFANLTSLATYPDGRVVVMHEMVVPFGYSVGGPAAAASTQSVRRFAVPLPEFARGRIDKLPTPPITEAKMGDLLAVALTATPDVRTGDLFYLTRTGRRVAGHWEKMVVKTDSALHVQSAHRLPGSPLHMTYLSRTSTLLIVDTEDQWTQCKLK